jgi:hypothetical protein
LRNGKREDHSNFSRLNHWTKGFPVIHSGLLRESSNDLAGFVPCQADVRVEFVSEYPFAGDNVNTCRTRYQRPSVILQQRIKFF